CSYEQPTHSTCADRVITSGSYSPGEHQGQQTDNKRKGSHQDWSQPHPCSFNCRVQNAVSSPSSLQTEFHNQNGVFSQQTQQHDQGNLEVDIGIQCSKLHGHISPHNTYRQRKQHGKWNHITFILRSQDKIDKDYT